MKRALVLGGGGAVGIAWETGIVAGLLEDGIDVREADLIIGTSAGSVVGTQLAHGADPEQLMERQHQPREPRALGDSAPDMSGVTAVFQAWASFDEMTQAHCAEVGRLALQAKTMPEEQWIAGFADNAWPGWPDKPLLTTAVDCDSGEFRAFDRHSGVAIERAVAASCAVPGLFPPVTIDGRRYTDGGVRSGTSADLGQRIEPDIVLIIAPMGARPGGIGALVARQLAREKGELEAAGAQVRLVQLDGAALEAAGPNFLDPARAPASADAGRAQAKRISAELRDFWHGTRRD